MKNPHQTKLPAPQGMTVGPQEKRLHKKSYQYRNRSIQKGTSWDKSGSVVPHATSWLPGELALCQDIERRDQSLLLKAFGTG